jgi:hypothetical protein
MSDFPGTGLPAHTLITNRDRMYGTWPLDTLADTSAWPSANRAIYAPVWVPRPTIITKLGWNVGPTSSGNMDVGVYDENFVKVVSTGSIAVSATTNAVQEFDIADTLLQPGAYYLAMSVDNATAWFSRASTTVNFLTAVGVRNQNSAFPLPATATPTDASSGYLPAVVCSTRIPVI